MDHQERLSGDSLYAKLEELGFKGDLCAAAIQNDIPNTDEALSDLMDDLIKNGVKSGDFKRTRMYPKRVSDPEDDLENIYCRAEAIYRRMVDSARTLPTLPLSTNVHLHQDIVRIDYIENARLQQEFFNTKSDFLLNGIPAKEQFMFHGTNVANIDSILNFNLRPDFQPIDRPKGAAYGEGIYFSEFPCVGVSYGTLIVCRVLAGRVQNFQPGVTQKIPDEFESRKVPAHGDNESSAIHVVKSPSQVLPHCVIILQDVMAKKAKAKYNLASNPKASTAAQPAAKRSKNLPYVAPKKKKKSAAQFSPDTSSTDTSPADTSSTDTSG